MQVIDISACTNGNYEIEMDMASRPILSLISYRQQFLRFSVFFIFPVKQFIFYTRDFKAFTILSLIGDLTGHNSIMFDEIPHHM